MLGTLREFTERVPGPPVWDLHGTGCGSYQKRFPGRDTHRLNPYSSNLIFIPYELIF